MQTFPYYSRTIPVQFPYNKTDYTETINCQTPNFYYGKTNLHPSH